MQSAQARMMQGAYGLFQQSRAAAQRAYLGGTDEGRIDAHFQPGSHILRQGGRNGRQPQQGCNSKG